MARFATLVSLLFAAAWPLSLAKHAGKSEKLVPGAYIFEFEDGQDTSEFYSALGGEGKTRMNLDYKLFKGVSVQMDDVDKAEEKALKMASTPAIKNVWPVKLFEMPSPKKSWAGTPSRGPVALSKRSDNSSSGYAPHVMTQVDKLHAKGVTGKGVKIAVIDTGVDYLHPALGGCFGDGCLVTFGTDLVGDAYDGYNTPVPDEDPMDCAGHGTHVSGIIAAQENPYGFLGAAPDAILGMYRVFGCAGEAANDVLIAAYNQAFEDGADIITASIGGPSGWADEAWSRAVTAIVDQGTPCTISAGNSGDAGLFYASTAANGRRVASIASFDNTESPTLLYMSSYTVDGGEDQEFGYTPGTPSDWDGVSLPLWAPDLDPTVPDGGCDPYPDDTPDLSGYIVLIRRGSCTFVQKAQNAAAHGAKYIMLYNNVAGTVNFDVSAVPEISGSAMVTPEVGVEWINLLENGSKIILDVIGTDSAETTIIFAPNIASGGALSTYTSWGPTWDLEEVNPSFGSPGGNILSTYPQNLGSYAVLSGTSMACPLVAATYALFSEARGSLDPDVLRSAFSAEANPQFFNDGASFYSFLAPTPQQGGGLIQAYDAIYSTTAIKPESMSFGDTENFIETLNFTLSNDGDDSVTYDISHVPTISMYTLDPDSIYPAAFPNEPVDRSASLTFSEKKITVPAGESVVVEVMPTPPKGVTAARLPVWSGWVAINGSDGSSLSLPYQGVSGSLHDHIVLSPDEAWVARSTDDNLLPVPANTTFVLPAPGSNPENATLPSASAYLALGSPLLRIDVVPVGNSSEPTVEFFGIESIGQPDGSPIKYNPRATNTLSWTGKMDNGLYAPAGHYKLVMSALRINGDPEKEADWDIAETPSFWIKYQNCIPRKR